MISHDKFVGYSYEESSLQLAKKHFIRSAIVVIVSLLLNIFTPTSQQALAIYGVGGTVDYIKSNDTAKQLPDKVVNALDKYLDSLNEKEDKK
jgi:hypothetical protein